MEISSITDTDLLKEISRRFEEKQASIQEMEFLTKKLLELNEQNKQAQDVKSKFLSLIKNEFNNPMSSLLNLSNLVAKRSDNPQLKDISMMIKGELLRMDFALKNIFAASEIEAGEIGNEYSKINIQSIYDEVLDYFQGIILEKSLDITLHNECNEDVISDSQKVYLILLNLVSNACEYSYENTSITVNFHCFDESYCICVENVGEGISQDHAKDIYNRFSHFESGKTRRTAGLGLGLSVARGMAEALNGDIDNVGEGDKTKFMATFAKVSPDDVEVSQGFGSNEFMFEDSDGMVEF